jgi:hypothetical protein
MVTSALGVFRRNIDRSRAFLRIFDGPTGRGPGQPSNDEKELLRGSVVFAVGALDAYFHDLVLEIVPKFGGDREGLKEPLKAIAKEDPSLALRVALAPSDASHADEFRTALDEWLEAKSFQGPEAVMRAAGYIGCALTWPALDEATGLDTAERLDHFTKMRHDIVHRGQRPYIGRAQAHQSVDLVDAVAQHVDGTVVRVYYTPPIADGG